MDQRIIDGRNRQGFLEVARLLDSYASSNTILDPCSLLLSDKVLMGSGNVFYPNVVIACQKDGSVNIGDGNIFYPGTYLLASSGKIKIGDSNLFGTGGCTVRADNTTLMIGSYGRFSDGANIMGQTTLGNGSQVLGAITVQSCSLGAGDSFDKPDPDKRGAVLKGYGLARNIQLKQGQVVNGAGDFAKAPIELQRTYHPKVSR